MLFSPLALSLASLLVGGAAMQARPISLPPQAKVEHPPKGQARIDNSDISLPAGYIEEELLVSGTGRVFKYNDHGEAIVDEADQPWVTRVLVRRPVEAQSSGWAFVEPLHPEIGDSFAWRQSEDYFARRGDTWIGITTTRNLNLYAGGDPLAKLKAFDPVRYAQVHFGERGTEGGLTWDVIAAVGRLAKSGALTDGRTIRKTMVGGWSGAGALTLFFANTFAMRERLPDGSPIFDAVLLGEPGWYPRINGHSGDLMPYDIRQRPSKLDVPMISVSSSAPIEFGMPFRPRADSDTPIGRYRAFEIAGADHRGTRNPYGGDLSGMCATTISDFPLDAYYSLAIDWLKRWSDKGEAPPISRPIKVDRYGKVVLNADGNPAGGVRSSALDVPVARYYQTHEAPLVACRGGGRMAPFPRAELIRRYHDQATYIAAVTSRVRDLVVAGWLLPADGEIAIAKAKSFQGFDAKNDGDNEQ